MKSLKGLRQSGQTRFFAFCAGLLLFAQSCTSARWIEPALQAPPVMKTIDERPPVLPADEKKSPSRQESLPREFVPGDQISLKAPSRSGGEVVTEEQLEEENARISENEKKEKKKKEPVTYSGSRLIREFKRFGKKGKERQILTLEGRARINHGELALRSGKIVILGSDGEIAVSEAPLTIEDKKNNIKIQAGYGKYFRFLRRVVLKKNPVAVYTDTKNNLKSYLYSREMVRDFKSGEIRAIGDVRIFREKTRGYGEEAVYYDREKKAVLSGNPVVYDDENIYQADLITYFHTENKIVLEGNVQVVLMEKPVSGGVGKEEKGQNARIAAVILGDVAEYRYGKGVKLGREVNVTAPGAQVKVLREDSEISCDSLTGRGDGLRELELLGNIELLDLKDRTRIYGELGHYWKDEDLIRMFSGDEGRRPYVVFHNREDVPTGKLVAELLERNLRDEKTYARGDVRVELYNQGGKTAPEAPAVMFGQWAEVSDEKRVISLRGEPYIEHYPDDRIYAREILVFPDENRMELSGGLHGNFLK